MALFFKSKDKKKHSRMSSAGETVESLVIALIMALIIKTSIVEAYKIPSSSMEDTLLIGDFLLANKFVYGMQLPIPFVDIKLPEIEDPKPGDIIIFKNPNQLNQNYIKRCIAVEGQTIEIKEKRVFIDGKLNELPEDAKFTDGRMIPFHSGQPWGQRDNMPPTKVPPGHLFVMGDNRDNSHDSRFWGFLDEDLVMGRALIIHWSWRPDEDSPGLGGFFSVINWIGYNIWHFPERVRWGRLATPIT